MASHYWKILESVLSGHIAFLSLYSVAMSHSSVLSYHFTNWKFKTLYFTYQQFIYMYLFYKIPSMSDLCCMASYYWKMLHGLSLLKNAAWPLITEGCCMASHYWRVLNGLSLLKDAAWPLITERCCMATHYWKMLNGLSLLKDAAWPLLPVMSDHAASFSNEWPCSIFQ
jgi:hypothetical protein